MIPSIEPLARGPERASAAATASPPDASAKARFPRRSTGPGAAGSTGTGDRPVPGRRPRRSADDRSRPSDAGIDNRLIDLVLPAPGRPARRAAGLLWTLATAAARRGCLLRVVPCDQQPRPGPVIAVEPDGGAIRAWVQPADRPAAGGRPRDAVSFEADGEDGLAEALLDAATGTVPASP